MRFTQWLSIVTIAIAVAVVTSDLEGQTVGQTFPDFFASDAITHQSVSLSDLRGRVVLVCFWASWCDPSCDEVPYIRDAYAAYHDKGLEVISVSMDYDAGDFRSYVLGHDMRWMQVMDGGGRETRLARQFGVHATPTNFLIDVNGTCVSSSLRTRRIAKAVERELKRVKAKDLARPAAASATVSSGPSLVTILSNELVEMKGQIDDAAAPVDRFKERLK